MVLWAAESMLFNTQSQDMNWKEVKQIESNCYCEECLLTFYLDNLNMLYDTMSCQIYSDSTQSNISCGLPSAEHILYTYLPPE